MQAKRSGLSAILAASVGSVIGALGLGAKEVDVLADSVDAFGNAVRGNPPQSVQERDAAREKRKARTALLAARTSKFPSANELGHMSHEKRTYWENRIANSSARWSRPGRAVPHAKMPTVLTRQLRRQAERREGKMPLGMYSETWLKQLRAAKVPA